MSERLKEEDVAPGGKAVGARWLVAVPLVAMGVIAPTACYYEDYSGGYGSGGYENSRPGSYGGSRYYEGRHDHHGHGEYDRRREKTSESQRQGESARERRGKESRNEGWKYEGRNEGGEEGYEEKK